MATLHALKLSLKDALRSLRTELPDAIPLERPLSDAEYDAGFDVFHQHEGQLTICPIHLRQRIARYAAIERRVTYVIALRRSIVGNGHSDTGKFLSGLVTSPTILQQRFPDCCRETIDGCSGDPEAIREHDLVLFCHSMYTKDPKSVWITEALRLLTRRPDGLVAVFHRYTDLNLDGLTCQHVTSFPTGAVRVCNNDVALNTFASFVAGFEMEQNKGGDLVRARWREICRAEGAMTDPEHLVFSAPDAFITISPKTQPLSELVPQLPLSKTILRVKNRQAYHRRPAATVNPTDIRHIQQCVRWAIENAVGLTVAGGSHSGQCIQPDVVVIDMSAFNQSYVDIAREDATANCNELVALVTAEAGCKHRRHNEDGHDGRPDSPAGLSSERWRRTLAAGVIGHLSRLHGLTCDSIVGAVVVSVESGQIFCVGTVPSRHVPDGAVRSKEEASVLWAFKGAGTNFGIVVSGTLKAHAARKYTRQDLKTTLSDAEDARHQLSRLGTLVMADEIRDRSVDLYLYHDNEQVCLAASIIESCIIPFDLKAASGQVAREDNQNKDGKEHNGNEEGETNGVYPEPMRPQDGVLGKPPLMGRKTCPTSDFTSISMSVLPVVGQKSVSKSYDALEIFDTELYISTLHGGHGSGKTSSFKRCVFLKDISHPEVVQIIFTCIKNRPAPQCYLHLLQGGGAVRDIAPSATAFGCRDWSYACVITGVWPRVNDNTAEARKVVHWVYTVAESLLPFSTGAYGADLGPDPRDASLAAKAFGPNAMRLARLKHKFDAHNVLAYACPLPKVPMRQLVILVTGRSGAGKDFCAKHWCAEVEACRGDDVHTRVVSISDATKLEHAEATGADYRRLLEDRVYKEEHRAELTRFFEQQLRQNPKLKEQHFLDLLFAYKTVDVLLITGIRESAPIAALAHLAPHARIIEVHIHATSRSRQLRRGFQPRKDDNNTWNRVIHEVDAVPIEYRPTFTFDNNACGKAPATRFAQQHLFPMISEDMQRLVGMVQTTPHYPHSGVEHRNILGIAEQPGGIALCTSLLQTHFNGNWSEVHAIVSCEAGGFIFASALALQLKKPLVLIRGMGKLPPPTVSIVKPRSNISGLSVDTGEPGADAIELRKDVLPRGAKVVVVDDVLASGKTLSAVLGLLEKAGTSADNVSVLTVAEFPVHQGHACLTSNGFGVTSIQSLLVFGGA